MSEYRLYVTRIDPAQRPSELSGPYPVLYAQAPTTDPSTLVVVLSEAQWESVKQAVLAVFK